jgi:hypothetical protein
MWYRIRPGELNYPMMRSSGLVAYVLCKVIIISTLTENVISWCCGEFSLLDIWAKRNEGLSLAQILDKANMSRPTILALHVISYIMQVTA